MLKIAQLAPHYQLVLSRSGNLDELEILTEVRAEFSTLTEAERAGLGKQLQHAVKSYIGVSARAGCRHGLRRAYPDGQGAARHRQAAALIAAGSQGATPAAMAGVAVSG